MGAVGCIVLVFAAWFFFFRSSAELVSTAPTSVDFGIANERPGVAGQGETNTPGGATNEPFTPSQNTQNQKIFQLAAGPIAGAVLIQTTRPTTTLARFIMAESGRVFDLPLDVPGALPRSVSNTTIPGIARALWLPEGLGALVQYESDGVRKTLFLGLVNASTTLNASANPQPTHIQYLPDNIIDLALSPDGKNVAYLLTTKSGVDGHVAKSDGTGAKKLFSSPLSQALLSWPAANTLLLQTKSVYGALGAAFSVDTRTGALSTLFFANALSSIADKTFSRVIYQTVLDSGIRTTFVHDLARNRDTGLSFSPIPSKCVWGATATSTLYCATPLQYVPPNYMDLWLMGLAGAADSLVSFNVTGGSSLIRATPGTDGGVPSDMIEISPSPDEKYLSFIRRSDRTLWGIRLTQ